MTVLAVGIIWIVAFVVGKYTWLWMMPVFGGLVTLIFIRQSLRKIVADPPHQGILVFLGRRLKKLLREGLVWLPLTPIIFDAIMVKVVKVNQDLPLQILRTPDKAEISVSVSTTWTPGLTTPKAEDKEKAEALIEFLNSGEEKGVKEILEDVVRDRLRVWAFSTEEGPANWEEAVAAKDDTIAILVKAILGEDLLPISSDIPTTVLLKYFASPQLGPTKFESEKYGSEKENGNKWEKLEKKLGKLSAEEIDNLKKQIEERRDVIQRLRHGNGAFYKKSLGITLNRFTINEVKPHGETAKAIDSISKETYQRSAEEIEIGNVLDRVKELIDGLHISPEQALEVVQTEREKITKTIQEKKLNISPETRTMIENLFPGLLTGLFQSGKQKK